MKPWPARVTMTAMATFILSHRHSEPECAAAFAAWSGVRSPLRGDPALAGCAYDDHRVFWTVEAVDAAAALALLPAFVATRTRATRVRDQVIP
jgi:hypothetical protein